MGTDVSGDWRCLATGLSQGDHRGALSCQSGQLSLAVDLVLDQPIGFQKRRRYAYAAYLQAVFVA